MQEAVYVQIAPESASDTGSDIIEDQKTTKQLTIACVIIFATIAFVAGLGLYFLIKRD
jgi:hypothetical protein